MAEAGGIGALSRIYPLIYPGSLLIPSIGEVKSMTGEEIKELRQALGWSQQQMAQELGVAWITVNRWERSVKRPSRMALGILQDLEIKAGRRLSEEEVIGRITRQLKMVLQAPQDPWTEEKIKVLAERIFSLTK